MSDLKSVGIKCEKLKMGFALEGLKFQALEGLKFQNKQTPKQTTRTKAIKDVANAGCAYAQDKYLSPKNYF